MTEEQRMLITKIELDETETGKPVVELYTNNARLRYPELRLFELSELSAVGIDPNELGSEPRYCRFWAYYTESDKRNQHGNPYRDVTRLEPAEATPGQTAPFDENVGSAILAELQAMRAQVRDLCRMLELAFFEGSLERPAQPAEPKTPVPEPPPEIEEPEPQPETSPEPETSQMSPLPLDEEQSRRQFGKLAGPAIRDGKISSSDVNELTSAISAGAINWRDALQKLKGKIA